MRHLLTVRYPQDKGCYREGIVFPMEQKVGQFSLHDERPCHDCKIRFPEKAGCNEVVLTITTTIPVDVLNFEQFASQFDNTAGELKDRCDFLLYDHSENSRKIAFCELTCSESRYVEPNVSSKYPGGKRAKAFSQMKASLEALLAIDLLNTHILTFQNKVAVFGWRERNTENPVDSAAQNMKSFSITPSSTAIVLSTDEYIMEHGFRFIQVKHPYSYNW